MTASKKFMVILLNLVIVTKCQQNQTDVIIKASIDEN